MPRPKASIEALDALAPVAKKALTAAAATSLQSEITAAILAERIRVSAILESSAAQSRPALAREIALRTNLDSESAEQLLLAAAPEDSFGNALLANATNIAPAASALDPLVQLDKKAARIAELRNVRGSR